MPASESHEGGVPTEIAEFVKDRTNVFLRTLTDDLVGQFQGLPMEVKSQDISQTVLDEVARLHREGLLPNLLDSKRVQYASRKTRKSP